VQAAMVKSLFTHTIYGTLMNHYKHWMTHTHTSEALTSADHTHRNTLIQQHKYYTIQYAQI